jgi:ATP-binding protein involved in chromosome partitioning
MRILGVIENMSGDVFGTGGGEELATELGVPLLGTVPLDQQFREAVDRGEPEPTPEIVAIAEEIDTRREPGSIVKALPLVS